MTRVRRIFGSITFRLALAYTLVFGASVAALFYLVFSMTAGFAQRQMEAAVLAEVGSFSETYSRSGIAGLMVAVNRRAEPGGDGIYLLVDPIGHPLAGNLNLWPRNLDAI